MLSLKLIVLFGRITMPFLKNTTSVPLFFVILQCFLMLHVSFLSVSVLFGNVVYSFIRRHSDDKGSWSNDENDGNDDGDGRKHWVRWAKQQFCMYITCAILYSFFSEGRKHWQGNDFLFFLFVNSPLDIMKNR